MVLDAALVLVECKKNSRAFIWHLTVEMQNLKFMTNRNINLEEYG